MGGWVELIFTSAPDLAGSKEEVYWVWNRKMAWAMASSLLFGVGWVGG